MPIQSCTLQGRSGFKWGQAGKCYTYDSEVEGAKERARARAMRQARAVEASRASLQHLTVRAIITHMAQDSIISMVDPSRLASIRQKDQHPLIQVYAIGHEGEAEGNMVGHGRKVIHYLQHAIQKLHDRLSIGIPAFLRHAATNSQDGRNKIGEVIGKAFEIVEGKARTLAAIYLYPSSSNSELDVASIEADALLSIDGDGNAFVEDLPSVTGIALSNHTIDSPGFPGATLLGALQAFKDINPLDGGGGSIMTREEIQAAIAAGKFTPEDLFAKDVLIAQPSVTEHVRQEKQTEYEHAKRVETKLGEERTANMESRKALEADLVKARSEVVRKSQTSIFESLVGERKLDDRQKAFITKNLAAFAATATDEPAAKVELNAWMDKQLTEYVETAKLFGIADTKTGIDTTVDPDVANVEDVLDPKTNPFIPA